jgi:hypothetical protein
MPIYTIEVPKNQIVAVGRPVCRLYRTRNAHAWQGHPAESLAIRRVDGKQLKSGAMLYRLEISDATGADYPLGDWSVIESAQLAPSESPTSPDPHMPVMTHERPDSHG